MARWTFAVSLSLALIACGGAASAPKPAPPTELPISLPPTPPPSASSAGSAARAPSEPLDPGLPASAAWLASIDTRQIVDALTKKELFGPSMLVIGIDAAAIAELGLDPARPVLVAQVGLDAPQRRALGTVLARDAKSVAGSAAALDQALDHAHVSSSFRVVLPVVDVARTKAAIGKLAPSLDLTSSATGEYDSRDLHLAVSGAGNVVVIDAGVGTGAKDAIASLRKLVRAGHAQPPPLGDRALHVVYRPAAVAELAAMIGLEITRGAISGDSVDSAMKDRIAAVSAGEIKPLLALVGATNASVFETVDVSARRDGKGVALEIRAEPGPAFTAPPAEAWRSAPSLSVEGATGMLGFSRAFVSSWPLPGDPPNLPLTESPAANAAREGALALVAALPLAAPVVARLIARTSALPGAAYAHVERFGYLLQPDDTTFFALLSKGLKTTDAECILAKAVPCAASERLKVDAPATPVKNGYGRLVHVKGSPNLGLFVSEFRAPLDAIRPSAAEALPVEMVLPAHVGDKVRGVDLPFVAPSQKLVLTYAVEGRTLVAKLTSR